MRRTRVKICGLRDVEAAAYACRIGADAIGMVFYPPSPRHIEPERAATLAQTISPFVSRVGLFLDPEPDWVEQVLAQVELDYLQFHGSETAGFCSRFNMPYLKAVPMADTQDLKAYADRYADAIALLLDSNASGEAGGSGRPFDWQRVDADLGRPLLLAGGLTPANVASGIGLVAPYGVDVSSGVERERGVKDLGLMRDFINEVRRADDARNREELDTI